MVEHWSPVPATEGRGPGFCLRLCLRLRGCLFRGLVSGSYGFACLDVLSGSGLVVLHGCVLFFLWAKTQTKAKAAAGFGGKGVRSPVESGRSIEPQVVPDFRNPWEIWEGWEILTRKVVLGDLGDMGTVGNMEKGSPRRHRGTKRFMCTTHVLAVWLVLVL